MKIALRKSPPGGIRVAILLAFSLAATVLAFGFIARSSGSLQTERGTGHREGSQEVPQAAGWWLRYVNAADGYSLALPPDWRVVPIDRQALDSHAQQAGSRGLAAAGLDAGVGLWAAVAPADESGSAASVNIIRQPLNKEMPVETFAAANIADLRKAKSTPTPSRRDWLALSAGKALRTELRFQAESNRISRVHCRLAWRGDAAAVADLGSGNGTRLDNQPLVAEREVALPARESVLEVAGVVRLGLRPVRGWQGLPPPPSDLDAAGPGALVVERQANRPELAYALVRNRVVIGGSGSELVVPGAGLGPQVVVARCRDHWLWAAWKSQTWRPIVPGEAIALGGISLTAVAGDHRLFH